MAYTSKITYPVYDLNSTLFVELVREVLQVEFLEQRNNHSKDYLPLVVKNDEYLVNPISDEEINPAYCAVTRAKSEIEGQLFKQENLVNSFIIQVVANGLENLRKVTDAIFIILNDMDVKHYFFQYKNDDNQNIIFDSSLYKIDSISTDITTKKVINNKDVVMGNLVLQAGIAEVVKYNKTTQTEGASTSHKIGESQIEIKQETNYI